MTKRKSNILRSLDWVAVLLYLLLLGFGLMNIYSADFSFGERVGGFSRAEFQMIWLSGAFVLAVSILMIDVKMYNFFAYLIYAVVLILLFLTIFLAPNINGSHSWLVLGPIRLQPAEFAKFAVALALARYMSSYGFNLFQPRHYWRVAMIILLPMLMIVLQQEVGSALVFCAFALVLFREGMSGIFLILAFFFCLLFITVLRFDGLAIFDNPALGSWGLTGSLLFLALVAVILLFILEKNQPFFYYLLLFFGVAFVGISAVNFWSKKVINYEIFAFALNIGIGVYSFVLSILKRNKAFLFITFFILGMSLYCFSVNYIFENVLQAHQQMRIKVFLGMENDPTGTGYNVNQSRIAIGSGGFAGKGFLQGTQTKLAYVPEQVTDFIFCNIGEEFGFVGSVGLLAVYALFLWRLVAIAERQRDAFNRIYGYSVVSIFLIHLLVNIGMVLGIVPVIGIPLPLISYGGSSLWGFTILLFIFLKLDSAQDERLH